MDAQQILRLGMYIAEIKRLGEEYGLWLQNAEVYSPDQTEPIARVSAGSGMYSVVLTDDET